MKNAYLNIKIYMIDIFTDGSTIFNQIPEKRRGGIGVYFGENDERNISEETKVIHFLLPSKLQ